MTQLTDNIIATRGSGKTFDTQYEMNRVISKQR